MVNEISNKVSFNDRLIYFKNDVKNYFETEGKNENGNEECLEASLIRAGNRLAKQAEEIINIQKAKIEELKAENERLKKNIDGLNIFTTNYIKAIRLQAIKEFADKLKEIIYTHEDKVDVDGIVILNRIDNSIDNLVKEMVEKQ